MARYENIQLRFFDYIKRRYSKDSVLLVVMNTLNLKKGAAYKRMNGETTLSIDELLKIANHFGVSLDAALGNEQFLSFEHPFIDSTSAVDFLDRYTFFLDPLFNFEGKSSLVYMANEIPVFYYFSYRHIFYFLLSVWDHLHWGEKKLVIKETQIDDPRLEKLRNDVANYYESRPVTEIWNSNMLSSLYQQILFCVTIRAFENKSIIHNLIREVALLIEHLHESAGKGQKSHRDNSNVKIFLNEFGNYQNLALYHSDKFSSAFIGFDMPHFIVSYNEDFCKYSAQWIEKIKRRSILISSEGYQFRELFFIKLNKDFEDFKERLRRLVDVYYE